MHKWEVNLVARAAVYVPVQLGYSGAAIHLKNEVHLDQHRDVK